MKLHHLAFITILLGLASCGIFKKKSTTTTPPPKKEVSSKKAILDIYSKKLGTEIYNEKLYTIIDQWIGVPYKFGGKNKAGIDCSNFSCTLLREAFSYPSNYYFPSSKLAEQGEKVSLENAQEGDLVFFSMNSGSKISHVGVYLANRKFVHASTSKGVIISSLDEDYYKKRFVFAKRIK